jgi:hypothetical protein
MFIQTCKQVVVAAALQTCVRDVLSRISVGTSSFRGLPQSLQANFGIVSHLDHGRFLPNPLQFIIHPPPSYNHPTLHIFSIDNVVH